MNILIIMNLSYIRIINISITKTATGGRTALGKFGKFVPSNWELAEKLATLIHYKSEQNRQTKKCQKCRFQMGLLSKCMLCVALQKLKRFCRFETCLRMGTYPVGTTQVPTQGQFESITRHHKSHQSHSQRKQGQRQRQITPFTAITITGDQAKTKTENSSLPSQPEEIRTRRLCWEES